MFKFIKNIRWMEEKGLEEMLREREEKVVFTFYTTTQAMKMEDCARAEKAEGRLIPVPRQISAGCGIAWSAPIVERDRLEEVIQKNGIEVQEVYEIFL